MKLLVAVVLSLCATTALAWLGCDYGMFFEPQRIDKALQDFYVNTKGPTNWPPQFRGRWDAKDPCAWDGNERAHPAPAGTRCLNGGWHPLPPKADGGLLFLEHFSGMAEGPVPPEFDAFQMTDFIGLAGNKLSGPLWNTSFHCFLHRLDISDNQFSGTLHPDFMQRNNKHAELFNFGGNRFEGAIPEGINELKELVVLLFNDNQFSGRVPDLSKLSKLRHLDLSRNKLSGTVGLWLKELKNLARVELDGNDFEGDLPELPPSVSHFSASFTKFTGKIPASYSQLPFLRYFNCTGCKIECPTPDFLNHVYVSSHCRQPRKWDA